MLILENKNPTETEKLMFKNLDMYLIRSSEECLVYAPVSTNVNKDTFPEQLELDENMIDWNSQIKFYILTEFVDIKNFFNSIDAIILIQKRMEELGFKKLFNNIKQK